MSGLDPTGDPIERTLAAIAVTAEDVRRGLARDRTHSDETNPSGDKQMNADLRADDLFAEAILEIDAVATYASEEREGLVGDGDGEIHVAMDPLDGTSNLLSNNAVGTIFGIYSTPPPASGRDLVASGFILYGPLTNMVVARDGVVTDYLLEAAIPQILREDITLPDDPRIYSFGGDVPEWTDDFLTFAREIEQELKLRYGGAMIADMNQLLTYGGIFSYPGLRSNPDGKLRLQYEGNPIAYIFECAGGASSNGSKSLLDVDPTGIHQSTPFHVGNTELVERLEAALD